MWRVVANLRIVWRKSNTHTHATSEEVVDCQGRLVLVTNIHLEEGKEGRKEGNVLVNDTLNTFYLRLYGFTHMVKEGRNLSYLMTHSTHLFTVIWHQTYG